jgi:hypothetical protein
MKVGDLVQTKKGLERSWVDRSYGLSTPKIQAGAIGLIVEVKKSYTHDGREKPYRIIKVQFHDSEKVDSECLNKSYDFPSWTLDVLKTNPKGTNNGEENS